MGDAVDKGRTADAGNNAGMPFKAGEATHDQHHYNLDKPPTDNEVGDEFLMIRRRHQSEGWHVFTSGGQEEAQRIYEEAKSVVVAQLNTD